MTESFLERIVVNPAVMAGKPVVRGTRIPVEIILEKLAHDLDIDEILLDYPRLTRDDIRACIEYAHAIVASENIFPHTADASDARA